MITLPEAYRPHKAKIKVKWKCGECGKKCKTTLRMLGELHWVIPDAKIVAGILNISDLHADYIGFCVKCGGSTEFNVWKGHLG